MKRLAVIKKRRALMALLMAVSLVFAAGCGSQAGTDDQAEAGEPAEAEIDGQAEADEPADDQADVDEPADDQAETDEQAGDEPGTGSETGAGDTDEDSDVPVFRFETTDLDGNAVSSEALFAESKLTIVNIWATFCGPCINEMPELEKLSNEYAEKDVTLVGLVLDVPEGDDQLLPDALAIVADTGVTYTNLRVWDGFDEMLFISAVPTTFFVDSDGHIVGDLIVGADPAAYRAAIDAYLNGLSAS